MNAFHHRPFPGCRQRFPLTSTSLSVKASKLSVAADPKNVLLAHPGSGHNRMQPIGRDLTVAFPFHATLAASADTFSMSGPL